MQSLHVFDFDSTLFRSPVDTPENRRKYEDCNGLPWVIDKQTSRELTKKLGRFISMRKGFYGRPETLEPPLVPDPAPSNMFIAEVCDIFLKSKTEPETIALILTGRHLGLKNHVLRILSDGGLVNVHRKQSKQGEWLYESIDSNVTCLFLGESGPAIAVDKLRRTKPCTTLDWKLWILEQYVDINHDLQIIQIWEDREEHVKVFQALNEILEQKVIVHHVTA